jgi:hypothetical protein
MLSGHVNFVEVSPSRAAKAHAFGVVAADVTGVKVPLVTSVVFPYVCERIVGTLAGVVNCVTLESAGSPKGVSGGGGAGGEGGGAGGFGGDGGGSGGLGGGGGFGGGFGGGGGLLGLFKQNFDW